ncbi:MAG: hypothetical protein JXQ27_15705 [Acidobacteria bacterium]|nr:hypothetical protein [Acidobacteriota bacterium]
MKRSDMNPAEPTPESREQSVPAGRNGQDLQSQARQLRRSQSTADIILTDAGPAAISRKTIIYLTLSLMVAFVLLYLLLSPATHETMSQRSDTLAMVLAEGRETVQEAVPMNEHQEVAAPLPPEAKPERREEPFEIKTAPVAVTPPATPPVTTPRTTTRRPPPPPQAKPQPKPKPAGPEQEAYQLLMEAKPIFASMVSGPSAQYAYQKYTAEDKGEGVYLFNFQFIRTDTGSEESFLWQVNLTNETIRPIGLNAAKLDRLN